MHTRYCPAFIVSFLSGALMLTPASLMAEKADDYKAKPPFLTAEAPPLVMLAMGKDHKLYYEAYNDASDLDEDGTLDVGYKGQAETYVDSDGDGYRNGDEPYVDANSNNVYDSGEQFTDLNNNGHWDAAEAFTDRNGDGHWNNGIDYYGYFDSYKCYVYNTATTTFVPNSAPVDAKSRPIKTCSGATEWSGDFLNYLTMSRMDALRKVLYGGSRSTDTATATVLRRTFIPQDAHSWGKEYQSIANDGYDIRDYTPLDLPAVGTRHLFASTNLGDEMFNAALDGDTTQEPMYDTPLLRVLPNNTHRIWEWLSKERPVADNSLVSSGTVYTGNPANHLDYIDLVGRFANSSHLQGSQLVANINGSGNPFGADDYYLTIFSGNLIVTNAGTYEFAVDGDDAVEVLIDGNLVAGWYGGHGSCNCTTHSGTITLTAGTHAIEFRHQEKTGSDNYYLHWKGADSLNVWQIVPAAAFSDLRQTVYDVNTAASTITNYVVQAEVCNPTFLESNCRQYPSGSNKPIGLLQRYGENNRMYFGLMSGSYRNNTSGGVLRKNISSINDEIDANNGVFLTTTTGIIGTIDKFRIYGFDYTNYEHTNFGGGSAWVTTRPMNDREFPNWGNPIGEIMYEALRYFAGKSGPTTVYDYDVNDANLIDYKLGLPKPTWIDPYRLEDTDRDGVKDSGEDLNGNGKLDGFESCAKPFVLVLSDINPSYDSDQLPGSYFNPTFTGDLTGLDVQTLGNQISTNESIAGSHFIGQNQATYDGACTPKTIAGFGDIRGMCPEEPTKLGTYYSASVAYYGMQHDISSTAQDAQQVATYAVGLASPLPTISIDVGDGKKITLVPFAKSVGGSSINATQGQFQPTNTIVDFYVHTITPTYGKFRVNFEDVEQGADHDMDAIVEYEYVVNADKTVTVNLTSTYAAGGIMQHAGYIISGTTRDGVYLEVRDIDTAAASDVNYFLDTPPTTGFPGVGWNDGQPLPLVATRTFTAGTTGGATLLKNPLWYAAKWGGFRDSNTPTEDINKNGKLDPGEDTNGNGAIDFTTAPTPDLTDEWDADGDGDPDNYFYVVNALRLEEQLNKSFTAMLSRASSGTAASVISNSRSGEGAVYQSIFYPTRESDLNELSWIGELHSLFVDSRGNLREDTDQDQTLDIYVEKDSNSNGVFDDFEDLNKNGRQDTTRDRIIVFTSSGVYKYDDVNENEEIDTEDMTVFSPDIPGWHNNGRLDTEDVNGDGVLQHEDRNCDGVLNQPLNEDANHNGVLDSGEDLNGNNQLDMALDEDANKNRVLDSGEDLNSDGRLNLPYDETVVHLDINGNGNMTDTVAWEDANANNTLDHEDLNCNGVLDSEDANNNGKIDITEAATGPFVLEDIQYLWAATNWLNGNSGAQALNPLVQRTYASTARQRHIFTFVDVDQNMVVDANEQIDFVSDDPVPVASLTDSSTVYPYLTLFESFNDESSAMAGLRASPYFSAYLQAQTKRQINYIRGQDQGALAMGTFTLPAMRNRTYNETVDTTTVSKTWRLGDVVYSTPTVASSPAEAYHQIYRDSSYGAFAARYGKRRTVVYVGANDGMIHAFNGGFYNATSRSFATSIEEPFIDRDGSGGLNAGDTLYDWNGDGNPGNTTAFALGAELWAYVPYNLLPHLYWLTEKDYPHVYYADLKPRIFDARVFFNSTGAPVDVDHPNGWGTIMAVGMRLGGGQIRADMDKTDGNAYLPDTDRTMKSAIVLFDITNPEKAPKVLAEIALDGQGYTTCYPAVVPMRSKSGSGDTATFDSNDWYLMFGSGPADALGNPATGMPLTDVISQQTGKMFIVDLRALVSNNEVRTVNTTGTLTTLTGNAAAVPPKPWHFAEYEANSYISEPTVVDFNIDFNADAAYFGTVSGNKTLGWHGSVRRVIFDDRSTGSSNASVVTDIGHWHDQLDTDGNGIPDASKSNSLLFGISSLNQPVSGPVTISFDSKRTATGDRERWVFFGTGRFMVREDAPNIDPQSYYGIKEPSDASGFTWGSVQRTSLLDVSDAVVYDDKTVENVIGSTPVTNWDALVQEIDNQKKGWYLDFSDIGERNLGGAALLGGLLTFTTYVPSQEICNIEGESFLRALYYKTGTAYYKPAIGWTWVDSRGSQTGKLESGEQKSNTRVSLGAGMAESPALHVGGDDGSTAFVQTSTGAIQTVEQETPESTKSGKEGWRERR